MELLLSSLMQTHDNQKNMKNPLVLSFLSLALLSCGNDFSVRGTISSDVVNGEYVYIKMVENGSAVTIDSCRVQHSTFKMRGTADSAFVASLYIGDIPILPFVAEKGNIVFDITDNAIEVGGTPLNDELNLFMREQARFELLMSELERVEASLILNGQSTKAAADYVSDSIEAVGASVEQLIDGYVRRNINNVLGPCIFALRYSGVPAPILNSELESLYNDAPPSFRNDAFVKLFYDVARENANRLEQQRLLEK